MAARKTKTDGPQDPRQALETRIAKAKEVVAKNRDKAGNDPKRRLAVKKLKRAQRQLGRIRKMEKKAEKKETASA